MFKVIKLIMILPFLVYLFNSACSANNLPNTAHPQPSEVITYSDPFAYCEAAGTVDAPDARYAGPSMPDSIIKGMIQKGIITADTPPEFQKNAVWRCMNSHVWVCHYGANLPCLEKADTSKSPTPEMENYCKQNSNVDTIPAAVTGRATIYTWKCSSGKPEVIEQVFQVDPRGYLANFWYELSN